RDGMFAESEAVTTSPLEATREVRAAEAVSAQSWYKSITVDAFG
ncbi:MAG: cytochrome C, partial [Alphaproteobacteria bacterium]